MRMLRLATALALAAATINAQSPLTTFFTNNNAGGVGGGVYFNLTVFAGGVTVTGLDCNLDSPATTAGSIDLFVLPGASHVGNENNIALWTLAASGTITSAGPGLPSNVTFTAAAPLSGGTYGVCIRHNAVAAAYTNGTGGNQTHANNELTLNAGSALNVAFGAGAPFTPRVWNGSIHYTSGGGGGFASAVRSGAGCPNGAASFYEQFSQGAFDMSNTSIQMVPSGGGYAVLPGTATFVAPVSAGLGLTDDSLSSPQTLPFTLIYPGGSTSTVIICSNGFIYLSSTGSSASYVPTVTDLLNGGPRVFPMWNDHLPSPTNNVHFDVDLPNNRALITWNGVGEFGGAGNTTMQVVLNASGIIEFVYQGVTHPGHPTTPIVGFSPGAGNRDPGNRDISATLPFMTQADANPVTQDATRPIIGTTCTLTTNGIPTGSLAGLMLIGGNSAGNGIDLTGAGATGCSLYVLPILATLPFATGSSVATTPVPIPNDPSLVGGSIRVQGAVVNLAANPLGVVTTNLVTLNFGNL